MLNEIGHLALFLTLAAAVCQSTAPLWAKDSDKHQHQAAMVAARLQFVMAAIAATTLAAAFLRLDFSLALVAKNAHSALPNFYRLGAVWGNHEGSLLLWILMLTVFGLGIAHTPKMESALRVRALAVQGVLVGGFTALSLFTANPFLRLLPPPIDGGDLNPILQDPALMFHPPLLYLGYVGFSSCWSITVAALWRGGITRSRAAILRLWALLAWSILGLGIGLGSWWAYYELGWGGFWFWDPVENAALMPWLVGTALIHCLAICAKNGSLKNWSALLAIITFSLSLLGAFLVRSGILDSVHTFADDPLRGLVILGLIAVLCGGAFWLYLRRSDAVAEAEFALLSKENALIFNNLLLLAFTATVLLGTLYPIFIKVLGLKAVTVGAPYFNLMGAVVLAPGSLALAAVPALVWGRSPNRRRLVITLALALVGGGIVAAGLWWLWLGGGTSMLPILLLAGLAAVFVSTLWGYLRRLRRSGFALPASAHAMSIAHIGFSLLLAAAITASVGKVETSLPQQGGASIRLADKTIAFVAARRLRGANYLGERGDYTIDGEATHAENRFYPAAKVATVEAAIKSSWRGNYFITLAQGEGQFSRLVFQPLISWLWVGVLLLVFGGLTAAVGGWRRLLK